MSTDVPSSVPLLGLDDIEQLELVVDAGLGAALDALIALRERGAHAVRGYALWHEYVLARFGDALARLRLPDGERLALVESMSAKTAEHPRGMPVRAQASVLGVAVGSVANDRRALGLAQPTGPRRTGPEPLPVPTGHVYEQAAEWLRRAAAGLVKGVDDGLTLVELAKAAGWTEGKASGALSDIRRRGLADRLETRRQGQRVHVAPVDVALELAAR